jgi:hypothetical protein
MTSENADSLYSTHFPALWQGLSTHPGVFFQAVGCCKTKSQSKALVFA